MMLNLDAQTPPAAPDNVEPAPFRLTAADRCDSCGAAAYVETVVNGTELLWCAHHYKKYEMKLAEVATSTHDERARLFEEQTRVGISA